MSTRERHLVLCGFMGAGKTTVGKILAARLGRRFVDMDAELEDQLGVPVATYFESEGEAAFRDAERDLARDLAGESVPLVVATGGGTVLEPVNRLAFLSAGHDLVHLRVTAETVLERLADDRTRPLLAGDEAAREAKVTALLDRRHAIYAALPNQITTDERSPESVADAVLRALSLAHRLPDE